MQITPLNDFRLQTLSDFLLLCPYAMRIGTCNLVSHMHERLSHQRKNGFELKKP